MTPISRRTLFAVVMLAAILTIAIAVPLQAATFVSPTPVPRPQPRPVACSGFYYRVLPGDTLSRIGVRFGVSVYNLQRCNGLGSSTRIFAGELLLIPRGYGYFPPRYPAPIHGGACWYRVHWGDTLSRIARRYGTSVWYMLRINYIGNPNYIRAGQYLRVPCY